MSNKQWGHGFRKGEIEGRVDELALSHMENCDTSMVARRLYAQIELLQDYVVGYAGHDNVVNLGLLSAKAICREVCTMLERAAADKIDSHIKIREGAKDGQ